MASKKPITAAVLVYQGGIANVFAVGRISGRPDGRNGERRLLQHAFTACEWFARGLQAAGVEVATYWCNEAGDIADSTWRQENLADAPFSDSFRPVGQFHWSD